MVSTNTVPLLFCELVFLPFFRFSLVFLGKDNSVKLGDFGLSKMIKSHDFASTYVGTPYYMSPEICAAERYTLKSDIWSLGCIIYELCAREPPFNAKTHYQLVQKIKSGKYPALPDCYSPELSSTIRECLRVNPDERPCTFDLLQLPIMRLMRKEKEVSDMNKTLRAREAVLAAKEAELAQQAAALESTKSLIRDEIDANLRREWEVKAQLEITKHINIELENLHRQFDIEVRAQVEAELKKRAATSLSSTNPTTRSDLMSSLKSTQQSSSSMAAADNSELGATTNTEVTEPDVPSSPPKRVLGTPMRRVQTMFAGNAATPGDVEMSEPSPMAISSLSLSPRRNPATKAPTLGGGIFKANGHQPNPDLLWNVPRDCKTPDSDDEDLIPSPTRNIKSNKNPFMLKNRPILPSKISNKPLPLIPPMQMSPEGPKGGLQDRPASPTRRLSKIPSATSLVHRNNEAGCQLGRKPSIKKEDLPLGKIAAKNNIRGRTLVELQQARAGGRPLSAVIAPGAENVSPKKASKDKLVVRRASDTIPGCVAVWDPERDEMPSPFLVRTKPRGRV